MITVTFRENVTLIEVKGEISNEGTVIVKGDLQVDGTTTTVDSFTVNLNDPIINLGVTTSTRTGSFTI